MQAPHPILVVGGRTTGLVMASELARHGAPVRIVDALPGIDPHCRATVLHSRTLEILQDFGIVDEVLAQGVKLRGMVQYADGRAFARVRFGDVDSPYPWAIALGQDRIEAVLERFLGRLGGAVERGTTLVDMEQRDDHVHATLRHADGRTEAVVTPWLVGCDGAHSTTRHLNREGFPGEADPHQYVIADVIAETGLDREEAHGFLTRHGALFFFVLPQGRTLVFADVPEHHEASETPVLADIQALVAERGPAGARVRDPRWLAWFRIHHRLAEHYRHGRVLLAGDAVHVHSLVGGHGMNTGMQDAYNLAWKLALVVRGRAAAALLDSYETERRAVAYDVVRATRAATDAAIGWGTLAAADRQRLERNMVVPDQARRRDARHREELDLDYRKSPICRDQAGDHRASGPHAGAQAPDAGPLECGGRPCTLFELLRGPRHTLLVLPDHDGAFPSTECAALRDQVCAAHGDLFDVYVVATGAEPPPGLAAVGKVVRDPEHALARRYGATVPSLYLIRPDGYVGYRGTPASAADLREWLDRVY